MYKFEVIVWDFQKRTSCTSICALNSVGLGPYHFGPFSLNSSNNL